MSLNISDFNIFFVWKLQPLLKKVTPLFPSNPPLKVEVLSSIPFLKIWLEAQPPTTPPPPAENGKGGSHYGHLPASLDLWQLYQLMLFRSFWICPIGFFQIDFDDLPTTLLMKAPNLMLMMNAKFIRKTNP